MLNLTLEQKHVLDADVKTEGSWLFTITENGTPHYWSRKTKTWDSQSYTYKVCGFTSIKLGGGGTEFNIVKPSQMVVELDNTGNSLNPDDYEGAEVVVKIVFKAQLGHRRGLGETWNLVGNHSLVSDSEHEVEIRTFGFEVIRTENVNQILKLYCEDWLQKYLQGVYPNTGLVEDLFPSNDPKTEAFCVPKIWGTAFIPIRSAYIPDVSSSSSMFGFVPSSSSSSVSSSSSSVSSSSSSQSSVSSSSSISSSSSSVSSSSSLSSSSSSVSSSSSSVSSASSSSISSSSSSVSSSSSSVSSSSSSWSSVSSSSSLSSSASSSLSSVSSSSSSSSSISSSSSSSSSISSSSSSISSSSSSSSSSSQAFYAPPTSEVGNRFYILGPDTGTYTIEKVRTPRQWPGSAEWEAGSYNFNKFTRTGSDGVDYKVAQFIIADANNDGEMDSNGLFPQGERFLDVPVKFNHSATNTTINAAAIIAEILEDFGVPSAKIDATAKQQAIETCNKWGLTWSGGIWFKMRRKDILNQLLIQAHMILIIRDKIYMKVLSKEEQLKVEKHYMMLSNNQDKYSYHKLSQAERKDSGYIAYQPEDEPIDVLQRVLVPAKGTTTDYKSNECLEMPFVHDSQDAQALGTLAYQRRYKRHSEHTQWFFEKTMALEVGDVLTINPADYNGPFSGVIDWVTITPQCDIQINFTKYSVALDDFTDLSPDIFQIRTDDSDIIAIGNYGHADNEFIGVRGISKTKAGVYGYSAEDVGGEFRVADNAKGQIRLYPGPNVGVPTWSAGIGTVYCDNAGDLYMNIDGSTTWKKFQFTT